MIVGKRQDGVVAANASGATGRFNGHIEDFVNAMFTGLGGTTR